MHGIFMGVTKKVTKLWLSSELKGEDYNVSEFIDEIDSQFLQIQVPHDFGRKPRLLAINMGSFKGFNIIYSLHLYIFPDTYIFFLQS